MQAHEPLLVSILYYITVFAFCEISRQVANVLMGNSPYKRYVYEFLAVLQVCTCVYENHLIVKYYGVSAFFLIAFTLLNCHRLINRGAFVSPATTVENFLAGRLPLFVAVGLTCAQLLAGFAAYRMAGRIWWLEFSPDHARQAQQFDCVVAYKVPMVAVALYEFFGAFLIRTVIGTTSRWKPEAVPYVAAASVATGLSFGIVFIGAPGLNPIIAFARLLGCEGVEPMRFFFIYWFVSIAGWMTAALLDKRRIPVELKRE